MQQSASTIGSEQLLAMAKSGDRLALQRLMLAHAEEVGAYIRGRLQGSVKTHVDADDILQLVFLDAFRDIKSLRATNESGFRGWLFQISRHRLGDTLRAAARVKRGANRHRVVGAPDLMGSVREVLELLTHGGRTPSGYVQRDEAVLAVQTAIRELPADYRRAIELRFLSGLSLEEIGQQMQRSPRAVQGLLDRAKRLMREMLEN